MLRVLVCGGRNFDDYERVTSTLSGLDIGCLIHGGARGADSLAGQYARSKGITEAIFPANWDYYGKRAGFVRNQSMVDWVPVDLVVAFPGGIGTNMMKSIAKNRGIKILEDSAE